jgi:hypothetical protein
MHKQTKKVNGYLLDEDNKEILAEATLYISLVPAENPAEQPHYEATMTVNGSMQQLSDKSHILKLNENTFGPVFIMIVGPPGEQTRFKVLFQGAVWNNPAWFESL